MSSLQSKPQRAANYQRRFWMTAARSLPHHALLIFSKRLKAERAVRMLSKNPQKQLARSELKTFGQAALRRYEAAAANARLWHGTGRFHYADGKVVDVLGSILANGSLKPAKDVYGIFVGEGEMVTISTTPLRIIARSYADTHGKGAAEPNRYGPSLWWVAYYYSLFYGLAFTIYSLTMLANLSKWSTASKDGNGDITWGKKVNSHSKSVWDTFGLGSDIPDNFPLLFGISRHSKGVRLPKVMEKAEIRLDKPVKMTDLSHIEVPEEKVSEVSLLLAASNIQVPVFPIELGEYLASQQPFTSLLGITKM